MFKIRNVYKALLILPEECKHPNLVLNLSSTKFSAKSKFSTIDSTKFSTAVYTTPFGACVRALWLARGAAARVSVNFRKFSPCIARAARPRGFDSLPSLSDVGTLSFR